MKSLAISYQPHRLQCTGRSPPSPSPCPPQSPTSCTHMLPLRSSSHASQAHSAYRMMTPRRRMCPCSDSHMLFLLHHQPSICYIKSF